MLQSCLIKLGFSNPIFISGKSNKYKNRLIRKISQKFNIVIFKSYKIADEINNFSIPIILNLSNFKFKNLDIQSKYNLMWSLINCKLISYKSKLTVRNIFTKNVLSKKIIVIPINDPLDVYCDYITQTAKTLAKKGELVFLIAKGDSLNLFKHLLLLCSHKLLKKEPFINIPNIQIIYPIYFLSKKFYRMNLIKKIDKKITDYLVTKFIKSLNPDLLWTFDSLDLELINNCKGITKTIYDCVDYFSTLDPIQNKILQEREHKLIKSVDYYFVNSNILAETRGRIKKPNAIVPQGFDISSFSDKSPYSKTESKEIAAIRKIFRTIPKPICGFIGNITYRIDFDLIYQVAEFLPQVSFVFTNAFLPMPYDDRFTNTQSKINKIKTLPNVYLIKKTKHRRVIKEIISYFQIGLIPYDSKYKFNKYCYPMKLFEYFYLGKPVVSTTIEELKRYPKLVKMGDDRGSWIKNINSLLTTKWKPENQKTEMCFAIENSWLNKVNAILNVVS
jgi:hypothetical protein